MRKTVEAVGFLLAVAGVAGTINHFWDGFRLFNLMNRLVIPRLGGLAAYELYVNLAVVVLGFVIMVAAARIEPS